VPDFQHFSDDWVPYHAAMEPLRNRVAATQAAATVVAVSGIAITTSTAISANSGLYDQLTSPVGWTVAFIQGKVIDVVDDILNDPASLLHWTANEWAMLHDWLRHIAVAMIHLTPIGFH
jgi:hypothetical protein